MPNDYFNIRWRTILKQAFAQFRVCTDWCATNDKFGWASVLPRGYNSTKGFGSNIDPFELIVLNPTKK